MSWSHQWKTWRKFDVLEGPPLWLWGKKLLFCENSSLARVSVSWFENWMCSKGGVARPSNENVNHASCLCTFLFESLDMLAAMLRTCVWAGKSEFAWTSPMGLLVDDSCPVSAWLSWLHPRMTWLVFAWATGCDEPLLRTAQQDAFEIAIAGVGFLVELR